MDDNTNDSRTRTTKGRFLNSPSTENGLGSCLIEIHGPNKGKQYILSLNNFTTLGRSDESAIAIPLDSVSRKHATIKSAKSKFWVEDLGSKNGTFLNDRQLEPHKAEALESGCLLKVGGAVFKYLTGNNLEIIEILYHVELERLQRMDSLTLTHNKTQFLDSLRREFKRAHQTGRCLSLALLDVDHFNGVKDLFGSLTGDDVLRQLASIVKRNWLVGSTDWIARLDGDRFAILIPEAGFDDLRLHTEKVRTSIENHTFESGENAIKITVSVGLACLGRQMSEPLELLHLAEASLYRAKKTGGNQLAFDVDAPANSNLESSKRSVPVSTDVAKSGTITLIRRPLDGITLLRWVLSWKSSPGPLLVFEVADKRNIIAELGNQELQRWNLELEDLLVKHVIREQGWKDRILGTWKDRILGTWKDRILVALGPDENMAQIQKLIKTVRSTWAKKPIPGHSKSRQNRSLFAAYLLPEEVKEKRERSLDLLEVKLLDEAIRFGSQETLSELPFPLAASREFIHTQTTSLLRFWAIGNALDVTNRFLASLGIALLREHADKSTIAEAYKLLSQGSRPTNWAAIAAQLAQAVPLIPGNAATEALHGMTRKEGENSMLAERVYAALEEHDKYLRYGHIVPDEVYREKTMSLELIFDDLFETLSPLRKTRLVSVAKVNPINDSKIKHKLHSHQGSRELFPIFEETLEVRLERPWSYLLLPNSRPLCLAPILATLQCKFCGRLEMFILRKFTLTGKSLPMRGIISNHAHSAEFQPPRSILTPGQ